MGKAARVVKQFEARAFVGGASAWGLSQNER